MDALSISSTPQPAATTRVSLRQRKKDGQRAASLQAARTVFSEKSFEAASISEVARLAEVANGTIYRHFLN